MHKSEYEFITSSSEECYDSEDVLPGETNIQVDKRIETEIKAFRDVYEDEGIGGLRRALSENANKWRTTSLHIAVTGSSGAGKSSFINAIRDVKAEEEGAAEVGETETTTKLTPFRHPKYPNFIVWDMPGVGTPNFPQDKYLECVKFDRYDFFMILSKSRFTEDDLWLAKEITKRGKCFFFVRTNIDSDISNSKRSRPKKHSQQQVIENVRKDCQKNLEAAGIDKPRVYLVDNLDRQSFDFGLLEFQLVQDSDGLKMEAMALSLSALTKEILQKKKEILEDRVGDKAMEIACLEDNTEEQKNIFDAEMSLYIEQFNLDEKELSVNKDILCLSDDKLKEFNYNFNKMSATTEYSLKEKTFSLFGDAKRLMRRVKKVFQKWGWLKVKYSETLLEFCSIALLQNLEEIYKTALKVYNLDAQKGLVKSVMSLKEKLQ